MLIYIWLIIAWRSLYLIHLVSYKKRLCELGAHGDDHSGKKLNNCFYLVLDLWHTIEATLYNIIMVFWKWVMYLKAFAEMQARLICSACQCWLFSNLEISCWFCTVSWFAALCLSSALHLFCLHLSPITFLEICLIPCTWNIHFLSLSPFQTLTDVCVCFLWVLVMCRGRCCVFLSAVLSFTPPPPFVFLCHTLSLPHALSFPLTPLSTSSCKESKCLF